MNGKQEIYCWLIFVFRLSIPTISFFFYSTAPKFIQNVLHLFGSYIYFGPTLYLYLRSLVIGNLASRRTLILHYATPFLCCLIYNIFDFKIYSWLVYVFLIGYTITIVPLVKQILQSLQGSLRKRFVWFIGITILYLVLDTPMILIEDLATLKVSFFPKIYPELNEFFYQNLHFPLLFLHFFILSLYSITEIPRFKKYFLSKSLEASGVTNEKQQSLLNELIKLFDDDQIYLDTNLSLERLSKQLGIEKSLVSKLLKEKYNKGFNEYVNSYRVQEFKRLVSNPSYQHYDLVGLANESGFKSKATFYRVFKEIEGITPNQYKNSLSD